MRSKSLFGGFGARISILILERPTIGSVAGETSRDGIVAEDTRSVSDMSRQDLAGDLGWGRGIRIQEHCKFGAGLVISVRLLQLTMLLE
jgi:hypothetical protein